VLTVTCDYSAVLAGAKKLQTGIKFGVKASFFNLVISGTDEAINNLLKSYKNTPGRPDFARTGNLERAVFTAINLGMQFSGGWVAGIGDMVQLYSMAPYWDAVEYGSTEYVGEIREGYWVDKTGKPWGTGSERFPGTPRPERYPVDRWIDSPGIEMTIDTPIEAHNFYKDTAEYMRERFGMETLAFIKGALGG